MAEFPSKKERMQIKRHPIPEQDPQARNKNFEEVTCGYTAEMALEEAKRCLQCKIPTCIDGCPVSIKIDQFLELIVAEDLPGAMNKIKEDNFLPAICGRVCPQEKQCEQQCVLSKKGDSVAIGRLERFVADVSLEQAASTPSSTTSSTAKKSSGKRVAVVGSGPAGLACAADLIGAGHHVTVFEALHELGGVLVYGIPEFRLPKAIVKKEINGLAEAGVQFITNSVIGRTIGLDELFEEKGFNAAFLGTGAGLPNFMRIPGEEFGGVYSANEFLTRVNLMKSYQFPTYDSPIMDCKGATVAVIGGGNTAMDAVRVSKRMGAKRSMIVYRRSEAEMPARLEEIQHAKEEGVEFHNLTNPLCYLGDDKQQLTGMECIKMELGPPDDSGRRRPIPIEGSEFTTELDIVIVAIGNGSNPLLSQTNPEIETNKWGNIVVNPKTMATSREGVFAGGDIVTGGATVILAMGAGRTAAAAINDYLETK
ncbi:MAG: NADPH-dependent glutamate synthase [Bdellovibrionales bacterium]|nr:NADPH-dependent glutamate synthase [Bdellovibrionales bacterium]